jgi:putative hydrolase of the HAD superfamily
MVELLMEREDVMSTIKAILFDFGGVLAEEGFKKGLEAIALKEGRDPERFFVLAESLIYSTGYVLGLSDEVAYWEALRRETGLRRGAADLRSEILDRFILRPEMIRLVRGLKQKGFWVGILSDQTDWLDELNRKYDFFKYFDRVFNSFHLHKSKKDSFWFAEVCSDLALASQEILFTDDNQGNIDRAADEGLKTILFQNIGQFKEDLIHYMSDLD